MKGLRCEYIRHQVRRHHCTHVGQGPGQENLREVNVGQQHEHNLLTDPELFRTRLACDCIQTNCTHTKSNERQSATMHTRTTQTQDSLCPETSIIVFLLGLRIRLRIALGRTRGEDMNRVFICRIDVRLRSRHGNFHLILVLPRRHHTEIRRDLVVTFRTPRYITVEFQTQQ